MSHFGGLFMEGQKLFIMFDVMCTYNFIAALPSITLKYNAKLPELSKYKEHKWM